jgi:eukaryotic-like serine/threonine-protein kinase
MPGPSTPIAGRYRLEHELGRGGMGVVWEAYDLLLRRRVAAKEICYPDGISDDECRRLSRRTLREARAVAAIDDPHALRVFDIVQEQGRPWIVMELVRGRSLTDEIRARGPLPAPEVARIGMGLVDALAAAHRAGVLHRDVKPSNVILAGDGRVKLTDFGIAAVDDDAGDATATGLVMGSPSYLAPERARGEAATPASDFWSLGATLWTAAEGRPPYRAGNAFQTMLKIVSEEPPACTQCDAALAGTLLALLARDPAARPAAEEVRRRLAPLAAGEGTSYPPTTVVAAGPAVVAAAAPSQPLPQAFDETTVLAGPSPEPGRPDRTLPAGDDVSGKGNADDQRPRRPVPALVATALLIVGSLAAITLTSSKNNGGVDGITAAPKSSATPGKASHGSSTSGGVAGGQSSGAGLSVTHPVPTGEASGAGAGRGGSVAAANGWQTYTDPSLGWSVQVPSGWTVERRSDGTTVFNDPAGGRSLLVGTRYPPGPSAKSAWEDEEPSFARSHSSYQRIRLENVSWRGFPDVADWEFTYVDGGAALHAVDRGAVINGRGYGLFFQTRTDQWDASQSVLQQIFATFRP